MNVQWSYTGLEFQHTPAEVDDETAWGWQPVSDTEFIIHAANLHLYRTQGETPSGQPLWLCTPSSAVIPHFEDFKVRLP